MQVKRQRQRKRGHPILAMGIFLALVAGISYAGASLWQNLQDASSTISKSTDSPGTVDIIGAQAEAQYHATPPVGAGAVQSKDSPSFSAGESADAAAESGEEPVTPYTVDWQVKASAEVPLSYFDDAVFFGDSVSTGLVGYHIVDNAACYAAIGVSPHTVLTEKYIGPTVDSKKTLLDAAKEAGAKNKVYVMLGGNGLWMDKDDFITGYQAFLDAVREQYPEAIIYIQSMAPVGVHVSRTYEAITKEKVVEYNKAIAELAKKNGMPFVNLFEFLMDQNGDLPEGVSSDGLHLTPEYYYKWLAYLRTHTVEE